MKTITKFSTNLKCIKGGKQTFSDMNIDLIKKAYPFMTGVGLTNLCQKIDQFVSLKEGNDVSAREHLKGRIFGLSGVEV
jgi:hypothetical protein